MFDNYKAGEKIRLSLDILIEHYYFWVIFKTFIKIYCFYSQRYSFLFLFLFLAVLGLRFCARAFSSCGKGGALFIACVGLSLLWPPLLRSTGSRCAGSVVVGHGPSCSKACGIFPDQGSNPCPLHRQADSQTLRHQGSPGFLFYIEMANCFSTTFWNDCLFSIELTWHLC